VTNTTITSLEQSLV